MTQSVPQSVSLNTHIHIQSLMLDLKIISFQTLDKILKSQELWLVSKLLKRSLITHLLWEPTSQRLTGTLLLRILLMIITQNLMPMLRPLGKTSIKLRMTLVLNLKMLTSFNPIQSAPLQDVVNMLIQNHQKDHQWTTQSHPSEKTQT